MENARAPGWAHIRCGTGFVAGTSTDLLLAAVKATADSSASLRNDNQKSNGNSKGNRLRQQKKWQIWIRAGLLKPIGFVARWAELGRVDGGAAEWFETGRGQ